MGIIMAGLLKMWFLWVPGLAVTIGAGVYESKR